MVAEGGRVWVLNDDNVAMRTGFSSYNRAEYKATLFFKVDA